jgi:hypothetical protein
MIDNILGWDTETIKASVIYGNEYDPQIPNSAIYEYRASLQKISTNGINNTYFHYLSGGYLGIDKKYRYF